MSAAAVDLVQGRRSAFTIVPERLGLAGRRPGRHPLDFEGHPTTGRFACSKAARDEMWIEFGGNVANLVAELAGVLDLEVAQTKPVTSFVVTAGRPIREAWETRWLDSRQVSGRAAEQCPPPASRPGGRRFGSDRGPKVPN